MPKIVCFHAAGAADVRKIEDMPVTEPGDRVSTIPSFSMADAHRYMESNRQKGKIVVTV
jgi:hypothetical protein